MRNVVAVLIAGVLAAPPAVFAQSLGTFRWQLQPFCNVVTLTVTQLGSQFRFEGLDDQCGAGTRAPVTGFGVPNADGSLEFALTIGGPGGARHVDVAFSIASLGGSWRDGLGGEGAFTFLPAGGGTGGSPLPPPAAAPNSVTAASIVNGSVGGADILEAEVQRRVTGTCGAPGFVRAVAADGTVTCGTPASGSGGTITGVSAGTGLTGGGTTGAVTLAVDPAVIQSRVTGSCPDGQYVRIVAANGTVTCGSDATVALAGSGSAATAARSDHAHPVESHQIGASSVGAGPGVLAAITTGGRSVAVGVDALKLAATPADNVALGWHTLDAITVGFDNIALGTNALGAATNSSQSIAIGQSALGSAPFSSTSIAIGSSSLEHSEAGNNLAIGSNAMNQMVDGQLNVALGEQALRNATGGSGNVAIGWAAMRTMFGLNGDNNIAIGTTALAGGTGPGSNNIAIGNNAGSSAGANNNNIFLANPGQLTDSGAIRIGTDGVQQTAWMAGIFGVNVVGSPVQVSSTGQLGVPLSSRRYKESITSMTDVRAQVQALRPVTFYYKPEFAGGERLRQYGLIAEEVDDVMPDLVVRGESGEIVTVRYQFLAPLLLAEVQRLERERQQMADALADLRAQLARLTMELERK